MLIRQKAGWRLHHQAYLWPRRSRSSPLAPLATSLQLPARRRSGASSGGSAAHSGDDSASSPLSWRRSSSGSSGLEGEDSSSLPSTPTTLSLRKRTGSYGAEDSSSPISSSSSRPSSPRKRKASGGGDISVEGRSPFSLSVPARRQSTRGSTSSEFVSEDLPTLLPRKRRRRSSSSVSSGESCRGYCAVVAAAVSLENGVEDDDDVDEDSVNGSSEDIDARADDWGEIRPESSWPSVRTRRDTRTCDIRGVDSSIPASSDSHSGNHCSGHKGSSSSGIVNCSSSNNNNHTNNNNNNLLHCGSNPTSTSLRESSNHSSIRETSCSPSLGGLCSRTKRMGVLCTEKHCSGDKCACGGAAANSPRPATLPTFPESPCDNKSTGNQDTTSHEMSRKRSLDMSGRDQDESGIPVSRRRTQRSPSAGSINGVIGHVISSEKLTSEISAVIGQNGFKHEAGLNGVKLGHSPYKNGTRPICCVGLDPKLACVTCVANHHHPGITSSSLSSPAIQTSLSSPSTVKPSSLSLNSSSDSQPCHNGKGINNSHSSISVNTAGVSSSASTNALTTGSIAHTVQGETSNAKRPQPPSSLLPLSSASLLSSSPSSASSACQQQAGHPLTQGVKSSHVGSSNSTKSSSSNSSNDDKDSDTLSSTCISASHNPTVLSLRHRRPSGTNAQKSSSEPASPQAAASSSSSASSCKSKSTMSSSSSSPSLSTLVTEPSSPSQSSTVQCKWRGCSSELDASDLLEHIRKHAEVQIEKESYACLWTDCKVFNKPSWSGSWLERHIVSHSGHRPFKCILDNCGQRFHSQAALERHVNGHFTASSQSGAKSSRTREEINQRMLQKRKRQLKRRSVQTVKRNDFFDDQTMAAVKQELLSLTDHTHMDVSGSALHTTFQGLVVGRRTTKSGSIQSLVEFLPGDILEDEWVSEEEVGKVSEISIPLSSLPFDTVTNLHSSVYRRHRFRKHRRK